MLKVKLLNDGGYGGMENVKFPVIVDGIDIDGAGCGIKGNEIIRIGADNGKQWDDDFRYFFDYDGECEVIEDES